MQLCFVLPNEEGRDVHVNRERPGYLQLIPFGDCECTIQFPKRC